MQNIPIFVILYSGLTHAFEADHLLALSNIVSQRKRVLLALNDGVFWGLGHTSTILLMGLIVLIGKMSIPSHIFSYLEAVVGCMLVFIAIYRLAKFYRLGKPHAHIVTHLHVHSDGNSEAKSLHRISYGVGLLHGLAGSGALLIVAMTQFNTAASGMSYLCLFGMGSIIGMLLAAFLFTIPFSKRVIDNALFHSGLIFLSSGLSILYGLYIIYENLV